MTSKFKVGDIVRTEVRDRWPKVIEIKETKRGNYIVHILETIDNFKQEIGQIYTFPKDTIDRLWELDPSYLARKQFDEDLEELLDEY